MTPIVFRIESQFLDNPLGLNGLRLAHALKLNVYCSSLTNTVPHLCVLSPIYDILFCWSWGPAEAGLELLNLLFLPPKCCDYRHVSFPLFQTVFISSLIHVIPSFLSQMSIPTTRSDVSCPGAEDRAKVHSRSYLLCIMVLYVPSPIACIKVCDYSFGYVIVWLLCVSCEIVCPLEQSLWMPVCLCLQLYSQANSGSHVRNSQRMTER